MLTTFGVGGGGCLHVAVKDRAKYQLLGHFKICTIFFYLCVSSQNAELNDFPLKNRYLYKFRPTHT